VGAAGWHARAIGVSTEQLLDSAPDGVVVVDGDGVIRLVNRQAEVLFGYRRDELVGRPMELLVPDRAKAVHRAHRAGYLVSPTPRPMGAGLKLSARRHDGSEFPVDISLSSITTGEGVLVFAAIRDTTELVRVEEERSRLEAQLHEAQREEERAHLEAQLHQSQRLESVGQLAGGIAHDFNNLLAGIMNYAALVADEIRHQIEGRGLGDDEAFLTMARDVEEITKVAKRAAALTHQLLIFSRREVVNPEVLDLNAIVADMEKLFRRTIGEDIHLSTLLAADLPRIRADRGQIEQVLMNLVVNARGAMPTGGRIAIETASFEVDREYASMHAVEPGSYLRLSVSDTGTGMPREVLERAFEPFFTTKPQGTGLGLSIARQITEEHGGELAWGNGPAGGAVFTIRLPVKRPIRV
jgi:hypothetical protein